jgi:hypothetical protein
MPQESSASRVAGKAYRTFEHDGVKYLLSQPLRMGNYGDEEALVLSRRIDPGDFGLRMMTRLPASCHAALWQGCAAAAMRGIPSEEEWAAYNGSSWKTAFMLWNTLDPKHKVDRDTKGPIDLMSGVQWALGILAAMDDAARQDLFVKIAIVSQDAAIKNSSGRPVNPEPANEQPMENLSTTDGPPSSNTSETATATAPTK